MGKKANNILVRSNYTYDFHKKALLNENMTRFLSDPKEKFDVILMEWFFSDLFAGIPPLFKCPFIWMASTDAHWQILSLAGDVTNPVSTPDIFDYPLTTLWGRTLKLIDYVKTYFIAKILYGTLEQLSYDTIYSSIAEKRGVSMPLYTDAVYNASLVFINSHPAVGVPHNIPLNTKYIGGYHMDTDLKSIPKHLQNIMDNAKNGMIFFCLGSNIESKFMSNKMTQSLLRMFSKFKQTVVWKYEDELKNVPANVYLEKWVPQLNILAHPNLKVFITHGGRMSITEAVHYGVPIIGMPAYADQFVNVRVVVEKNLGIEVTLTDNLAEDLEVAIKKILDDPIYSNNARELSSIYRHRLLSPGQELVYWTEHVVKSRGAKYLRPAARKMPLYQKLYLDIILALICIISLTKFILCFVRKMVKVKEKLN
ncbi:UDP-glucosyltransferase 2-like [Plodia interpunctella]|uniref:UDP-glucosyltransferase 2-like n=1 Tax=Plodia interpunctella TaxID=58824 RepID=UPI0023689181|nr:UDP-glucosyltransferase 2-like [Plodia interpunctella]